MDCVIAFGVLSYTGNPLAGFKEMVRVTKKGGWVGVWTYPRKSLLPMLAFRLVRRLCRLLPEFWVDRLADLIVPFLGFLPTGSKLSLGNSSWRECREVVLVNITPNRLEFFSPEDIKRWFKMCDITVKYIDKNNPITIWGVRA